MRIIALLLLALLATSRLEGREIRISAGAGMRDAVTDIARTYSATHPGTAVAPNFGPSGALAGQIMNGAPADIFISANTKWMTFLVDGGTVERSSVRPFARNSLVLVGTAPKPLSSMRDLEGLQRIALGSPKSVPAGEFAMEALIRSGMKERLQGRLVMAKDVRECLMYAELGSVEAGFVYRTDALLARKAAILLEVPRNLYPRIEFPMGLTERGGRNPDAREFFDYLRGPEARKVLVKYGYVTP